MLNWSPQFILLSQFRRSYRFYVGESVRSRERVRRWNGHFHFTFEVTDRLWPPSPLSLSSPFVDNVADARMAFFFICCVALFYHRFFMSFIYGRSPANMHIHFAYLLLFFPLYFFGFSRVKLIVEEFNYGILIWFVVRFFYLVSINADGYFRRPQYIIDIHISYPQNISDNSNEDK